MKIDISIDCKNNVIAQSILNSLGPDNDSLKYSKIEMCVENNNLNIHFYSNERVETIISTIDDILACCQASINTLGKITFQDSKNVR